MTLSRPSWTRLPPGKPTLGATISRDPIQSLQRLYDFSEAGFAVRLQRRSSQVHDAIETAASCRQAGHAHLPPVALAHLTEAAESAAHLPGRAELVQIHPVLSGFPGRVGNSDSAGVGLLGWVPRPPTRPCRRSHGSDVQAMQSVALGGRETRSRDAGARSQ